MPMTYESLILILILISALGSAIWNIGIKKSSNAWLFVTLMVVPQLLVALPLLINSPLPSLPALLYIMASACVQTVYILLLSNTYKHGLVSRIYPLAIGTAPLLSLVIGYFFLSIHLTTHHYFGIILLSTGIIGFAFSGNKSKEFLSFKGIFYALSSGVFIFLYSLIDTFGIKTVNDPLTYISWLFFIKGLMLLIPMMYLHKLELINLAKSSPNFIFAGLLAGYGYGLAIFAFKYIPTSMVLSMRSTSILFVYILSIFILQEKASWKVFLCSLLTSIGVLLVLLR
jgi:drug/metabolite transporter (DMT)-like permease